MRLDTDAREGCRAQWWPQELAPSRKAQQPNHKTGSLKARPRSKYLTAPKAAEGATESQSGLELQLPTGLQVVASRVSSMQQQML